MNESKQSEYSIDKISLKKISRSNLELILNLKVKPRQRALIATNAYSIAQAHFTRGVWFRAIYLEDIPIGFVMLRDNSLKHKYISSRDPEIYLWRFMIDGRYQGKGYGKKALELIIEYAKSRPNVKEVTLHHEPAKGNAGEFYKQLGFKYTGKIFNGELEMKLKLG